VKSLRLPLLLLVPILLFAGACSDNGGGGEDPDSNPLLPLPEGEAPDIVLLSVSGHGGAVSAIFCESDENRAYLMDGGEATEALLSAFDNLGLDVLDAHFSDRVFADESGLADRLGFAEMVGFLKAVQAKWITGQAQPTRVVIVAHSHGATWAHLAVALLDEIPIEYLITLDGICLQWECEHTAGLAEWLAANGFAPPTDLTRPCELWTVGEVEYDTKDVAFDNVSINLEVHSNGFPLGDCCTNVRLDGTTDGIETFMAPESHSGVTLADSVSMAWVVDEIVARETVTAD